MRHAFAAFFVGFLFFAAWAITQGEYLMAIADIIFAAGVAFCFMAVRKK